MCSLGQWMLEPSSAVWCTSEVYRRLYFIPFFSDVIWKVNLRQTFYATDYLSFQPTILGVLNCAFYNIQSYLSWLQSLGQVQPFGLGVVVLSLGIRRTVRENRKYFSLMVKHIALRFTRWRWAAWRRHNVFLVNEEVSGVGNFQFHCPSRLQTASLKRLHI